jgi:hypothetical protein
MALGRPDLPSSPTIPRRRFTPAKGAVEALHAVLLGVRTIRGSTTRSAWRYVQLVLLVPALLSPPILTLAAVARYGITFPVWDQWEFPTDLSRLESGQYRLVDLFRQHNEHRSVFPRLAFLALARLSGWDIRWELYANVALAALTLVVLWRLLALTTRGIAPGLGRWLVVPVSFLIFSLVQFESWGLGWQLHYFLSVWATVVSVWALARWPGTWSGLLLACAAGFVAAFSLANGLLVLALVPLAVFGAGSGRAGRRLALMLVSVGVAVAVFAGYFAAYQKPLPHPALFGVDWLTYLSYVLMFTGAPVAAVDPELARLAGLLGIVALVAAIGWLWRRVPAPRSLVVPWGLLALYALGSAAVTAMARAGFGATQGLSSRYTTIAMLFWVSLVVLGGVALRLVLGDAGWRTMGRGRRIAAALTTLFVLGSVVSFGVTYRWGRLQLKARAAALRDAEECVLAYRRAPDACLQALYPSVPALRERAAWLEAHGIGPFAPARRPAPLSRYVLHQPPDGRPPGIIVEVKGSQGAAATVSRRERVVVEGGAVELNGGKPPRAVLVVVDGEVLGVVGVRAGREPSQSFWRYRFGGFRLSPGAHRLEAYAVLSDGRGIARMAGTRTIEVTE